MWQCYWELVDILPPSDFDPLKSAALEPDFFLSCLISIPSISCCDSVCFPSSPLKHYE